MIRDDRRTTLPRTRLAGQQPVNDVTLLCSLSYFHWLCPLVSGAWILVGSRIGWARLGKTPHRRRSAPSRLDRDGSTITRLDQDPFLPSARRTAPTISLAWISFKLKVHSQPPRTSRVCSEECVGDGTAARPASLHTAYSLGPMQSFLELFR